MDKRLNDKVAIITGGSRGIGRATALLFAKEGARVCVNYCNDEGSAKELESMIKKLGCRSIVARADVRDRNQVKKMVSLTEKELGPVDVLVNNAGILHYGDIFEEQDSKAKELFSINVDGIVNCTREVREGMMKRRYGKIVNIASIAGIGTAARETTPYAISKAAAIILTKRLALELGEYGINVNAIAPGYVRTGMTIAGKTEKEFEEATKFVKQRTILSRIGSPEDIAFASLYFASDESSFVTGQILTIDGGRMDYLSHSM